MTSSNNSSNPTAIRNQKLDKVVTAIDSFLDSLAKSSIKVQDPTVTIGTVEKIGADINTPPALTLVPKQIVVHHQNMAPTILTPVPKVAAVATPLVVVDGEVVKPKPAKNYPTKPGWELVPGNDGIGDIRISDPYVREFIYHESSASLINGSLLISPDDNEHSTKLKNREAVVSLRSVYINIQADNLRADPECYDDGDPFSEYALTKETYDQFIAFATKAYEDIIVAADLAFEKGAVTFVQLQLVLNKGSKTYTFQEGGDINAFICREARIHKSMFGVYLDIAGMAYVSDGYRIGATSVSFQIGSFEGIQTLEELGIALVKEGTSEAKTKLVVRGRKYIKLTANPQYVGYEGILTIKGGMRDYKANATGRIMIDRAGMGKFKPNYSAYYGGAPSFTTRNSFSADSQLITDDIAILMPAVVYGFSFTCKLWGEMNIEHVTEIKFRPEAFDQLQLPLPTKNLLSALVENISGDSDIIAGKGGGFIGLLAGNPGTGKTLTAETMAERLKRPLYMVNVGELGTNASQLESSLQNILDTATAWNALLLIDEADIFLEARNDHDIERNAMVAVFLRLLEYYQGVLFLTTNRAKKIDPAFYSRIHLALHYEGLTQLDRQNIWANLMARNGIKDINPVPLSVHNLNGRQIKNSIANARALAKFENHDVTEVDFKTVIDRINDFESILEKDDTLDHITKR